jgi:recombination protein RecA
VPPRGKPTAVPVTKKTAREILDFVNSQLGKNALRMASDKYFEVQYLPTGLVPIDHLLKGGIPFGRFVVFHGDYSSLKSYIGLCAIAQAQKRGLTAALIDTEHAFDPGWAASLGINLSQLIIEQPETGERAIDLAEALIRAEVNLIVFDSVAAALPMAEQKKSMEDPTQMARQAAMMSKAMRKLTAANKKTAVIWINQTRVNVGVMFGNPESVPSGKALPYYASYIIGMYKAGQVVEDRHFYKTGPDGRPVKKSAKLVVGQQIRAVVAKSKLNSPHRETTFAFSLRECAVDDWSYMANLALDEGLVGYDRGKWWLADDPKAKKTTADFRGHVDLETLKKMLTGMVEGVAYAGTSPRGRKPDAAPSRRSSAATARKPTPTVARAASPSTARLKMRS